MAMTRAKASQITTKLGSTGAVRGLDDKLAEFVSVKDFGASPAALPTSNVTAITAAVAAFPADTVQRGAVWFAPGEQIETNTEILLHRKSLTINGQNTAIKWEGADANASIFRVTDSSRVKFCDMALLGDLDNPPLAAIRFFRNASGDTTGSNENCTVENVVIGRKYTANTTTGGSADTTPYAKVQNGILIDGSDGNNDEYVISNVQVHSASTAAINFANTQSIWSSINNVLVNDSAIGVRVGCNLLMNNINANRIASADILGIRNTESWLNGFNSENSLIFVKSQGGASFFVRGGELQRNSATPSNFFRWENGGSMVLNDLFVDNVGGSEDTIYYRPGSLKGGIVRVANCTIKGGESRNTWDIDTNIASAQPVEIDIDHGSFKWKTTRPYADKSVTPPAVNSGASGLIASGSVTSPLGNFYNVAYQLSLQGQHLTTAPEHTGQMRARVFNVTAGLITLGAGRLRWLDVGDQVVAQGSATYDAPLMANNTGVTTTITVPGASFGDFVVFGADASYINNIVTAYVSAANTVALRIHNATGGNSDPASTVLRAAKLREFGNFQNTLAYTPATIANAATVTLTCTVPGAQVGAHAFVAYTNDLQGLICTAYVSAADTVTIVLTNYTGGSITLGAGYFKVMVAF